MELAALGRRVQFLRKERGLTLQELATAAAVSPSMLSSVERGQKAATIVVLARIAERRLPEPYSTRHGSDQREGTSAQADSDR